jgi:hypothetical protein
MALRLPQVSPPDRRVAGPEQARPIGHRLQELPQANGGQERGRRLEPPVILRLGLDEQMPHPLHERGMSQCNAQPSPASLANPRAESPCRASMTRIHNRRYGGPGPGALHRGGHSLYPMIIHQGEDPGQREGEGDEEGRAGWQRRAANMTPRLSPAAGARGAGPG